MSFNPQLILYTRLKYFQAHPYIVCMSRSSSKYFCLLNLAKKYFRTYLKYLELVAKNLASHLPEAKSVVMQLNTAILKSLLDL